MSNNNLASVRGIHVSPGIYTAESSLQYAVKSIGITTLGLVGETLKGPAFQPMMIENWRDFTSMFGGTSAEKFSGSQYPKYELPYIAKSYLTESNQLQVCRVLGLSGYNAGPAWVITAEGDGAEKRVVAVLRSRGHYEAYRQFDATTGTCECPQYLNDALVYEVGEIDGKRDCDKPKSFNGAALKISLYNPFESGGNQCEGYGMSKTAGTFNINSLDHGHFTIEGIRGVHADKTAPTSTVDGYFKYPVSLNPSDKDYILKVLGTNPSDGEAPIYVEALYDVGLEQLINEEKLTKISSSLTFYQVYNKADYCGLAPVNDIITKSEETLSRKDVGKRFLADKASVDAKINCHPYDYKSGKPLGTQEAVVVGTIYTVAQFTGADGKRHYYYRYYKSNLPTSGATYAIADKLKTATSTGQTTYKDTLVKNLADGHYYRMKDGDIAAVTCDMNDYKEAYRFASTPWIVSNLKGDADGIEVNKLFRFHTISDGNSSNYEVKASILNVKPDEGTFDVLIRDINDTDASPVILERYTKCTLVPTDSNYIAYKIGSYDGTYETKSKYVTVEVNETTATKNSVPCGFLGYPLSRFDGVQVAGTDVANIVTPYIKYNTNYDEDVKHRKQYFGLSDIVGVDIDSFTYKGRAAYEMAPEFLSDGFHLDCRVNADDTYTPTITVDGVEGYKFVGASVNNRTAIYDNTPIIGTEAEMENSIYEYVDLRKFTVYFYGGFDGWDAYRSYRSNTDEFKMTKYKGEYDDFSGEGYSFDKIENPELIGLNQQGITSDFYAYLAAARQFANPEAVDINVFATPGIDLLNNTLLSQEIIEMIEEERADSIYVAITPDKPLGASDYVDEMLTPDDVVYDLEDTEIDSNYTCTYYPWVKYEDVENSQYIYLSPTKDVVRNMAKTDNTTYPWFAPAGIDRGDVDCVRAHYITKLDDEDVLYEGRINPIKTFAVDGVKIWGQKNLQTADNDLNRIAVRRLLLRMRKLIVIACIGLIFEPNDATIKNKFLTSVTPIMDNIKANRGISDYRIEVMDTLENREKRELPAAIYFKPYKALEYIPINFVLTDEGIEWSDI